MLCNELWDNLGNNKILNKTKEVCCLINTHYVD